MRKLLLTRHSTGQMPASLVCSFDWHAAAAGAKGVEDLALPPKSAHQTEHIRNITCNMGKETFYVGKVPMWDHIEERRKLVDFPMDAPHDRLVVEYEANPQYFHVDTQDNPQLPRSFFEHPVHARNGRKTFPIGYFSDGVQHTQRRIPSWHFAGATS